MNKEKKTFKVCLLKGFADYDTVEALTAKQAAIKWVISEFDSFYFGDEQSKTYSGNIDVIVVNEDEDVIITVSIVCIIAADETDLTDCMS